MTQLGIELQAPESLANTPTIMPMGLYISWNGNKKLRVRLGLNEYILYKSSLQVDRQHKKVYLHSTPDTYKNGLKTIKPFSPARYH